jgi:hypothetical protein
VLYVYNSGRVAWLIPNGNSGGDFSKWPEIIVHGSEEIEIVSETGQEL